MISVVLANLTWRGVVLCAGRLAAALAGVWAPSAAAAERLPSVLGGSINARSGAQSGQLASSGTRAWTVADLVEVRWVTDVAVSRDGHSVAFLIKRSFLDSGTIRYGIYVTDPNQPGSARKLLESAFLADLAAHPNKRSWTVRADLGDGIQLYEVGEAAAPRPLIINSNTALVGTWQGVIAGLDGPHQTGVLSYEWAPDGSALWYSRLRLRSRESQQRFANQGIVYDDRRMNAQTFRNFPGLLEGTELRVREVASGDDRLLAYAPSIASTNLGLFRRDWGTAAWADSRNVRYSITAVKQDGEWETRHWSVNVDSGAVQAKQMASTESTVWMPAGAGYLSVRVDSSQQGYRLLRLNSDGTIAEDRGPVTFSEISAGHFRSRKGELAGFLSVSYPDRDGLVALADSSAARALIDTTDNLSHCDFDLALSVGACVRESMTLAPEVVKISTSDGSITPLVRPNAQIYDEIAPLRSEHARWKNRYGHDNDGYITYPRGYSSGQKYPAIVVTHARDARNRFAYDGFQWEFPVQLFAEQGYIVLSVNEPIASLRTRGYLGESFDDAARRGVEQLQFDIALDAIASMEAAALASVKDGTIDPKKIGIAGYSRGAEVALYTMSQSKMFAAAAIGDGSASADTYWSSGNKFGANWNQALYGGSPYDSDSQVLDNYRRLSPSFRAAEFNGPLLQQFPAINAPFAFELRRLLLDAGVATELVFYPDESHIFWHPERRAAAMQRNLDWFDYWLRGICDSNSAERVQSAPLGRWRRRSCESMSQQE